MNLKKITALTAATSGLVFAGAGIAMADTANGQALHSPGLLSGNNVQVPVHIPVNACGNALSIIGLFNPSFDNTCSN
ncbi:MAG TPA: chaplin [Actinocrinis sp.]|nr:chaplin [Actinocrinis sp.]